MDKKWVPWVSGLGSLLAFALAAGCGPLGREQAPSGPPVVAHIVFLDQVRGINPDLLNNAPARACDPANPCQAPVRCGELYFYGGSSLIDIGFPFPEGSPEASQCHDAENINEVPAGILADSPPTAYNTTSYNNPTIRVVFNQQIDNVSLEDQDGVINDPNVFQLLDPNGNPVPGTLTYDVTGSTQYTSDPGLLPYGPALVFDPDAPLAPSAQYRIQLSSSLIRSRSNRQPLQEAQTRFSFTTEGLFVLSLYHCPAITEFNGNCYGPTGESIHFPDPEDVDDNGELVQTVAQNQALQYQFNASVDPASLSAITVAQVGGGAVSVQAAPAPFRDDAGNCSTPTASAIINIYPVDLIGTPTTWTPGTYTVTIPGGSAGIQSAANPAARTTEDYAVTFTVTATTVPADEAFAIPDQLQCP